MWVCHPRCEDVNIYKVLLVFSSESFSYMFFPTLSYIEPINQSSLAGFENTFSIILPERKNRDRTLAL